MILEQFLIEKILLTEANDVDTILNVFKDGSSEMYTKSLRKYLQDGFLDIRFKDGTVRFKINPDFAEAMKQRLTAGGLDDLKIENAILSQFRIHLLLLARTFSTVENTQENLTVKNMHNYVVAALLRNTNGIRKVTAQTGAFAFNLDLQPAGN